MTVRAGTPGAARAQRAHEIFAEIHRDLPREGPGDAASTERAWRATGLSAHARVLDVGCGPGAQTIDLARVSAARITALDLDRGYLEELQLRAEASHVRHQVRAVQASMFALPFVDGAFDAIWSEGAIYILGFERGLREWRPFLRREGRVAVTQLSWLQAAPDEPRQFWARAYPAMKHIDEHAAMAAAAGFEVIEQFVLPESAWWQAYYDPLERRLAVLRERFRGDAIAAEVLSGTQAQIDLYRRFARDYGYVFYVLRAISVAAT